MELMVGFEIHQQLDSHKLFCQCPSLLREELGDIKVMRRLRTTQSELGEVDEAAREEFLKGKDIYYRSHPDTTCLVEFDEEPPHIPNEEAIDIGLEVATLLHADIVDEVHFMRKLVIDGSNTSGFQRTAIIAMDGYLETDKGKVKVPTICLEEEAARKVDEKEDKVIYNLDRLGIPLIEIATAPEIKTSKQAIGVAQYIGDILRATEKVKRGLGTIRQDINVSIKDGARTEIKGVQELNQIPSIIENEIKRQKNLIEVKKELQKRGVSEKDLSFKVYDVSDIFSKSQSKIIAGALKKNGRVLAIKLKGFNGLLKDKLGPEFAQYARVASGIGGIFHKDELPGYRISQEEVDAVSKRLGIQKNDVFVISAGSQDVATKALEATLKRARMALDGVPKETRVAKPNGITAYMRPLPGAARMYPETDIPPVAITEKRLKDIREHLPEMYKEKIKRFKKEYKLGEELAAQLVRSGYSKFFESEAKKYESKIAATVIGNAAVSWAGKIPEEKISEVFAAVASGKISKEAISDILEHINEEPSVTIDEAIEKLGIVSFGEPELRDLIKKILEEKTDFIDDKGYNAAKPLMGVVMKEVRGRIDGKKVDEILREELTRFIEQRK
ncbi:MAG: Glu-tRNA(Gln) amidotransferase subunit GatE [Candidatus Hydrothermarchaeales archaeon]